MPLLNKRLQRTSVDGRLYRLPLALAAEARHVGLTIGGALQPNSASEYRPCR